MQEKNNINGEFRGKARNLGEVCNIPCPRIREGFLLCKGIADEGVIVVSAVEGRVGAYQMDTFVGHFA